MTGGQEERHGELIDGRFELLGRLGSGGMGTVWWARDTALQRDVALKEVRPPDPASAAAGDEGARMLRERVLREARALARIDHPNVVTIHHIVDAQPHPWLVMELVPGTDLADRLADGPLPPQEAARIGRDVLAALSAAHAAGIHHRDVKPANVLLRPERSGPEGPPNKGWRRATGGRAVLTDFGIAALQGSTALTSPGEVVGSPEFIAPERIRGTSDHPAADFWSLGMLLYVAVEGVSPLRRGTVLATLAAVLEEPLPPPRRAGGLAPVLEALLVRDPAARPDAAQLDAMLQRAAETPGGGAAPPAGYTPTALDSPRPTPPLSAAPPARTRPGARRTGLVIAVMAGALALLGGMIAGLLLTGGGDGDGDGDGEGQRDAGKGGQASPTPSPKPPKPSPTAPSQSPPGTARENTWVAVLASEPVANGAAARDRRLANIRTTVPEAQVLRSDDYASLRPGYWVIHEPGPFADGKAAVAFCAESGRTTINACYGRYLSQNPEDSDLLCDPKGGGSGRCTRP